MVVHSDNCLSYEKSSLDYRKPGDPCYVWIVDFAGFIVGYGKADSHESAWIEAFAESGLLIV